MTREQAERLARDVDSVECDMRRLEHRLTRIREVLERIAGKKVGHRIRTSEGEKMNGFEKFIAERGDGFCMETLHEQNRQSFIAGLRHAAEISGNEDEDCYQEEYPCLTVDRIVQSIESEAQKIEKGVSNE